MTKIHTNSCNIANRVIACVLSIFMFAVPIGEINASAIKQSEDPDRVVTLTIDTEKLEAVVDALETAPGPIEMEIPDDFCTQLDIELDGCQLVDSGSGDGYLWSVGLDADGLKMAFYNSGEYEITYQMEIGDEIVQGTSPATTYEIRTEMLSQADMDAIDPALVISAEPTQATNDGAIALGHSGDNDASTPLGFSADTGTEPQDESLYAVTYLKKGEISTQTISPLILAVQDFEVSSGQNVGASALTAPYTIRYMVEKPNIVEDPGTNLANYRLAKTEVRYAPVNSVVEYNSTSDLYVVNCTEFNFGGSTTVKEDGSSVVSVYFKRLLFTLQFDLAPYAGSQASLKLNDTDTTYTQANATGAPSPNYAYTVQAKWQQDIRTIFPVSTNAQISREAKPGLNNTKFAGWKIKNTVYTTVPNTFTIPIVPSWDGTNQVMTATAQWEAEEKTAPYTIRYMVEKPNIVEDPGTNLANYRLAKTEVRYAPVNSVVEYNSTSDLYVVNCTEFNFGGSTTVKEDGSSVVSVYFKRLLFTLQFDLAPYAGSQASLKLNDTDTTYTQANATGAPSPNYAYTVQAKWQQDIRTIFPVSTNAQISREAKPGLNNTKFAGWKIKNTVYTTVPNTFTIPIVPSWDGTNQVMTATAQWEAEEKTAPYTIRYMVEKPNIVEDPGTNLANYRLAKTEVRYAPVNSVVEYNSTSDLYVVNCTEFNFGGSTTVKEDGSSVVSVYFKRLLFTLQFDLAPYAGSQASLKLNDTDTTYTQAANATGAPSPKYAYTVQAKWQQDIRTIFPVSTNAQISREAKPGLNNTKFAGWKIKNTVYTTVPNTFTIPIVPSWDGTNQVMTATAQWEAEEVSPKQANVTFAISGAGGSIKTGEKISYTVDLGTSWSGAGITSPAIVANTDYAFDKWDTFPTTISDNVTIYGRFVKLPTVPITSFGYAGTYDEKAHGMLLETIPGTTITYGYTSSNCSLSASPTITNVIQSPLTVYYQVSCPGYATTIGSETIVITPKVLDFSAQSTTVSSATKIYGDSDPSFYISTWPTNVSSSDFNVRFYRDIGDTVGSYATRADITSLNTNYTVSQNPRPGVLLITKRTVTITAVSANYIYNRKPVTLSGVLSTTGLLPGHTLNGVTTTVQTRTAINNYPIIVLTSGWSATNGTQNVIPNYELKTVNGTLAIVAPSYVPTNPGGTSSPGTDPAPLSTTTITDVEVPKGNLPQTGSEWNIYISMLLLGFILLRKRKHRKEYKKSPTKIGVFVRLKPK